MAVAFCQVSPLEFYDLFSSDRSRHGFQAKMSCKFGIKPWSKEQGFKAMCCKLLIRSEAVFGWSLAAVSSVEGKVLIEIQQAIRSREQLRLRNPSGG